LPPISGSKLLKPVMLSPGSDRLATKPSPTGSETTAKTIGMVVGGALERRDHGRAVGHDHVGLRCDQLRRMARDTVGIAAAPAVFEADISPIDPPQALHPLAERRDAPLRFDVALRGADQKGHLPYGLALPRAPRQRPRRCSAAERG
jgi:hypothetical protein